VIGMCARAGPLEQGREARSGSTQRDETKTILHIWQSIEHSDPLTIVMEMSMQMNVDVSWDGVASCSSRSESSRDRTAIWYDEARGLGTPVWEVPRVQTTDLEESTCGCKMGLVKRSVNQQSGACVCAFGPCGRACL